MCLRLPHSELFRDEAVLDHLVNVFFLSERTLVVEVHVAHLLTDVGLVHALRVVSNKSVIHKTLPYEAAIYSIRV